MAQVDWQKIFEISDFWAVKVAKEGIQRAKEKNKKLITVRCANTPTGVLHIGNANDVIRCYFIAKCIEILGYDVRVVFTSDDRDPIRGFPRIICDKEGNLVEFPEKLRKEYEQKYDAQPVCMIPDPFKCHSSWAEHFLSVYFRELEQLGITTSVRFEYYSPNILYFQGEWDSYVEKVLKEKEKVKEIYKEFKQHIREYAFSPICENCGKIGTTHVTEYDEKRRIVKYICEKRHLKKKTVEGCGYEGYCSIRQGKVDWYIEWAIDWAYFDADIEPMGKDHWVSSYRISPKFHKELFDKEAPIPVPYEFFTVNGQKMSGSKGNIYNLTEFLKMLEPEIVLYLYTKRPMTQRDIELKNLNLLVDEWDMLESKVFKTIDAIMQGEIVEEELKGKETSERRYASPEELVIYYLCMHGNLPKEKPTRIPYNFAAIIGQLLKDEEKIKNVLVRTGHISDDISSESFAKVLSRIEKATYWVKKYGPEILRINIVKKPSVKFRGTDKEIITEIISELESVENWIPDEIQTKIHSVISSKAKPKEFYPKIYRALLGKDRGPKLGTLLSVIGKDKALELLKNTIE